MAVFDLSLRRSYGRLLNQPEMFENAERQRYEDRLEQEGASLARAQPSPSPETGRPTSELGATSGRMNVPHPRPGTGAELVPDAPMSRVHPEDLERSAQQGTPLYCHLY